MLGAINTIKVWELTCASLRKHVTAAHRRFRSKPQRALVNVTITAMANQIKVGGAYRSQMLSAKRQFNVERERGEMKLQII